MQQNEEGPVVTTGGHLEDQNKEKKVKQMKTEVKNVKMGAEKEGWGVEGADSAEGEDTPLDISVGVEDHDVAHVQRAKEKPVEKKNILMMKKEADQRAEKVKEVKVGVAAEGVAVEVAEDVVASPVVSIVVEVVEAKAKVNKEAEAEPGVVGVEEKVNRMRQM
jgi:hypothetical protein